MIIYNYLPGSLQVKFKKEEAVNEVKLVLFVVHWKVGRVEKRETQKVNHRNNIYSSIS